MPSDVSHDVFRSESNMLPDKDLEKCYGQRADARISN